MKTLLRGRPRRVTDSFKLSLLLSLFFSLFFSLLLCRAAAAQTDPDPDSPAPVLLSEAGGERVLAVDETGWNGRVPQTGAKFFRAGRRAAVTLFVTNLDLLDGEGANAFRVYLRQRSGRTFGLQVEGLSPVTKTVYALKVRLFDGRGWRGQPVADGDSLIYLTWRGLASNYLKIGVGRAGGGLKILPAQAADAPQVDAPQPPEYVGYRYAGDRMRFLEQAAFGPSPEVDARLRRLGLRVWLGEQFDAPYPTLPYPNPPQMPLIPPPNCTLMSDHVCYRERYTMQPLQQWFFKEAMYGNAQLRHRVAWALGQIWVTSGVTVQQSSHMIAYHKVLSENAFGNYRDLMEKITLNPAMGFYLDMVRSTKDNPNENYPREILQLFTIGLYMLNQDGSLQTDAQGNPVPTYSQETVNSFSKVFTGWTYCNTTCQNSAPGVLNYKDPMLLNPSNHDTSAKTLLDYPNAVSREIAACPECTDGATTADYANQSLKKALDNIFYHPNVAPFVGKLLIQHLVTSDPSPAYVGRVAAVFRDNGAGVRGDLKAVVRAILLDPEARGNLKTDPRYGKLREPAQLLTNLTRIFPAKSFNGFDLSDGALSGHIAPLGQVPFYPPTVFNYFSPEYVVPGTSILAPEFELLNTGTAIKRTNLLYTLIFEGLTPNATDSLKGTSLDLSELVPLAEADASGGQLLDALGERMMHGALTSAHRNLILTAVQAVPAANPLLRVKTAVYLIAASSQYQIQR